MSAAPLVFLVAGEPSGDALGAQLMAALKRLAGGQLRFAGIGGERMAGEGLASLFPLEDLAVMGFAEVAPRLPLLWRRMRETEAAVAASRPAVLVTIDSPGFTLRLARRVRPTGVKIAHYVAPQLWAWRPQRARRLAGLFDRLMVLFPFEPEFFARFGIDAVHVGHPVVERVAPAAPAAEGGRVLAMLPGSRRGLVRRMLPVYGEAARILAASHPGLELRLPVVAGTRALVAEAASGWGVTHALLADDGTRAAALAGATAAVTTSGTATLELAVAGVPMAVTYRGNPLSAALARRWITVSHVAMPNLIAGRTLVPELLQQDCTPARVAAAAARLLDDPAARAAQRAGFAELRRALGAGELPPPSERAARVVLELAARGRPGSPEK